MKLILASTSKYRKALLERVGVSVSCIRPDYDEAPIENISARDMVLQHGMGKAQAVAKVLPKDDEAYIIGSDQGLIFEEQLIGKPGSVENAVAQLMQFRGKTCDLITSLCLLHHPSGDIQTHVDVTKLVFADLSEDVIRRYVACDMPIDCAGSFKIEARGPELFDAVATQDPTAIEGLPVMALCKMLRKIHNNKR